MKISQMNYTMIQDYLKKDNRVVVPLGSIEQHANLSIATDMLLAEKVAIEAAEPLGIPVYPVLPFGVAPSFIEYPGTISIKLATYGKFLQDILSSLSYVGFQRIIIVNGHGGNSPAFTFISEWLNLPENKNIRVKWHNWWAGNKTMAKVKEIDRYAAHASWMENFRDVTRIDGQDYSTAAKAPVDYDLYRQGNSKSAQILAGDGNFGGAYEMSDEIMNEIMQLGILETREIIEKNWLK